MPRGVVASRSWRPGGGGDYTAGRTVADQAHGQSGPKHRHRPRYLAVGESSVYFTDIPPCSIPIETPTTGTGVVHSNHQMTELSPPASVTSPTKPCGLRVSEAAAATAADARTSCVA